MRLPLFYSSCYYFTTPMHDQNFLLNFDPYPLHNGNFDQNFFQIWLNVIAINYHIDSNFPCNFKYFETPAIALECILGVWCIVEFKLSIQFENLKGISFKSPYGIFLDRYHQLFPTLPPFPCSSTTASALSAAPRLMLTTPGLHGVTALPSQQCAQLPA